MSNGYIRITDQPDLNPPRRYRRIIERVCARDRGYFEKHPEAQSYTRDYVPGEAWPVRLPQGSRVRVTVLGPGLRARWLVPSGPAVAA